MKGRVAYIRCAWSSPSSAGPTGCSDQLDTMRTAAAAGATYHWPITWTRLGTPSCRLCITIGTRRPRPSRVVCPSSSVRWLRSPGSPRTQAPFGCAPTRRWWPRSAAADNREQQEEIRIGNGFTVVFHAWMCMCVWGGKGDEIKLG